MLRFIGKRPYKKYVRPINNRALKHKVKQEEQQVKENNNVEKEEKEVMNSKIEQIENILSDEKLPKRKVKVEKKDKGLLERTENSVVVLTEDNKRLLND